MGTVRGVCAILPDWHSATFRHDTKLEIEALAIKNCSEGGSEYSGSFIFKNSVVDDTFLRNAKTAILSRKVTKKRTTAEKVEIADDVITEKARNRRLGPHETI